jgi:hypothetical protein
LIGVEIQSSKKSGVNIHVKQLLTQIAVAVPINIILLWILGSHVVIISPFVGIASSFYIKNRFFKFFDDDRASLATLQKAAQEKADREEVSRLQRKFKSTPNFSILEVLLHYGYISNMHKEYVEVSDIFSTPDELSQKFLQMPILTVQQLKEAKAIMNVIRREGRIVTKKEALVIIGQIQERKVQGNDENTDK